MKKKKNNNYNQLRSFSFDQLPDKSNDKDQVRTAKKVLARFFLLILNTVISYVLYIYLTSGSLGLTVSKISMWAYLLLLTGFFCAYIIYNKGFTIINRTPESLPENWSMEKKQAVIDKGKELKEKSKWMLLIIIPLLFTFLIDMMDLFVFDIIRSFFES